MMYDENKIIPIIIVFVILVTFPLWYNLGKAAPKPERENRYPGHSGDERKKMYRTQGDYDHHPYENPG